MREVTPEEAVCVVKPGQRMYFQGGAATPHVLIEALVARAAELRDVEIVHLHTDGEAPHVRPEMSGHFRHNALFIGANTRDAVNEGRADYTPVFLSEIPQMFKAGGSLPLDVAFIHVSPPDTDGNCTLGVSVDCALAAAWNARTVVAQVNPNMPRTSGHSLPASLITYGVQVDEELPEAPAARTCDEFEQIGGHVAQLVQDGSTLQLGIGGVPNAVLARLGDHRDLGIHTEMFTDGVLPLVEAGVINGARKTLHPGVKSDCRSVVRITSTSFRCSASGTPRTGSFSPPGRTGVARGRQVGGRVRWALVADVDIRRRPGGCHLGCRHVRVPGVAA